MTPTKTGGMITSFVHPEQEVAVAAELARLRELAAETWESIETVAANQVQLYRRSLAATREALNQAVNATHRAERALVHQSVTLR
jgi:hypothetical protein